MKNVFTNIDQANPITTLFKELYFPLKSESLSESSPPIPTTIAKFFEIIAYHFDQVYKERVIILNSSFPSNSIEITDYMKPFIIEPKDPDKHNDKDLTDPININNAIYSRFNEDLEKFAKERGLHRMNNEKVEQFQSRIINAHRFLLTSPTLSGLKDLITTVIKDDPKEFTLRELHTEDWILGKDVLGDESILGNNTPFYFIIDFKKIPIKLDQKTYLEDIINLYKPAHVGFHINAFILDNWILGGINEKLGINTYLEHR